MYITYETAQYCWNDKKSEFVRLVKPLITILNDLPKPDFMPTKLVRISDMKVVDGSQVNEGYCALAYSWNQSGDILIDKTTGKYKRIDEGRHEIISLLTIKITIFQKRFNTSNLKASFSKYVNNSTSNIYGTTKCASIKRIKKKKNMKYVTCIKYTKMLIALLHLYLITL
ncbi:hypothetical protein BDA99DRAFT_500377, partial [Phascolomyces articulosus]